MTPVEEILNEESLSREIAELPDVADEAPPTTAPPLDTRWFACYANNGQPGKARGEEWEIKPNRAERRSNARRYVHSVRLFMAQAKSKNERMAKLYAERAARRARRGAEAQA